jgi:hypothetical protein
MSGEGAAATHRASPARHRLQFGRQLPERVPAARLREQCGGCGSPRASRDSGLPTPSPNVRSVRKPNRVSDGIAVRRVARGCPCPVAGRSLRQEAQSRKRWDRGPPRGSGLPIPSPNVRSVRKPNRVSDGIAVRRVARGCPCPVAGRSRMPSWHPLSACPLRFAGHRSAAGGLVVASLAPIARLPGHGQPLAEFIREGRGTAAPSSIVSGRGRAGCGAARIAWSRMSCVVLAAGPIAYAIGLPGVGAESRERHG